MNYLLNILETILTHIEMEDDEIEVNNTAITVRGMRDGILSARQLLFDKDELLAKDRDETKQINKLNLARDSLQEIYRHIQPVSIP